MSSPNCLQIMEAAKLEHLKLFTPRMMLAPMQ
jgi:hypothetical protein